MRAAFARRAARLGTPPPRSDPEPARLNRSKRPSARPSESGRARPPTPCAGAAGGGEGLACVRSCRGRRVAYKDCCRTVAEPFIVELRASAPRKKWVSAQIGSPTFLRACWPSCCTTSAADAAPALQRSTSSSATTPPRCCRCRTLLEQYVHQVDTGARILSTPPFAHQPADNQATATHRARAAPPQDQGRVHQRARQPLLAQQRAREERTAGALGRRQQHARVLSTVSR